MGAKGSKSASGIQIPDINGMATSERPQAVKNLVASMNGQTIAFGFRKVDPDSRGEEVLKSFAQGMTFLPEYAIRIEGHSNLAKSEKKLTTDDKARIQKLSEDRADACARFLKAAGVQNEITCVGQGALKGQTKGCVRLVLSQKWTPLVQACEMQQSRTLEGESDLLKKELDNGDGVVVEDSTPDATTEEALIVIAEGTDNEVLPEEGTKPSDAEETDAPGTVESSAVIEPLMAPEPAHLNDASSKEDSIKQTLEKSIPTIATKAAPPPSSAPDQADQWGSTHLPWYITCCMSQKARPKTDECPMQGLPVKQMQLLQ